MQKSLNKRYFYEYAIYNVINDFSKKHYKNTGNVLNLTTCYKLHDQIVEKMPSYEDLENGSKLTNNEFKDILNDVMVSNYGEEYTVFGEDDSSFLDIASDYVGYTGISKKGIDISSPKYLPISPYDKVYRDLTVVKDSSPNVLFISDNDLGGLFNKNPKKRSQLLSIDPNLLMGDPKKLHQKVNLKRDSDGNLVRNENGKVVVDSIIYDYNQLSYPILKRLNFYREINTQDGVDFEKMNSPCLNQDDLSNISMLKRYMSEGEYIACRNKVNLAGLDDPSLYMSKEDMKRPIAILEYLQSEGINYTIKNDTHPGQLKAEIIGTNINVRLMDTSNNITYVGGVYDDGFKYYYGTDKQFFDRELYQNKQNPYVKALVNPTPEQTVDLLKFALGRDVINSFTEEDRLDNNDGLGKNIGEAFTYEGKAFDKTTRSFKSIKKNASYSSKEMFTASVADYDMNYTDYQKRNTKNYKDYEDSFNRDNRYKNNDSKLQILVDRRSSAKDNIYDAEEELRSYVDDARENFVNRINIDGIIDAVERDDIDSFVFDSDKRVSNLQDSYFSILMGDRSYLVSPFEKNKYEELYEKLDSLKSEGLEDSEEFGEIESEIDSLELYDKDRENLIRNHIDDSVDYFIGQYDLDENGQRFNPTNVANFMASYEGEQGRYETIVRRLRKLDMDPSEIKEGDEFYNTTVKDKLVKFDKESASKLKDSDNKFLKDIYETLSKTVNRTGAIIDPDSVEIDKNGIVRYEADRIWSQQVDEENMAKKTLNDKEKFSRVSGEIGQIFLKDDRGLVTTNYASTKNYKFAPGYRANIVSQKEGENESYVERTRLTGYEKNILDTIKYQVRHDMLSLGDYDSEDGFSSVGQTTSINKVYKNLYDKRYDLDYDEKALAEGKTQEEIDALYKYASQSVKYDNFYRDNANLTRDYLYHNEIKRMEESGVPMIHNDLYTDAYSLTGMNNIAILDEQADGYFDPYATGTGQNQGVTRRLVEGVEIDYETGKMTKSDIEGARCAIMGLDICKNMDFDSFDRQQMVYSNLVASKSMPKHVGMAMTTFGGYNFDDGFIIDKDFANKHQVIDSHTGELRDLKKGDKISDLHGNKGVVTLIVDKEMDPEEAKEKNLENAVKFFKDNPDVNIVMPPFSAVSRFNAGSSRDILDNERKDLVLPDGEVVKGGVGFTNFIIPEHTVDNKTHVYTDKDFEEGKGRSASGQLIWALMAQDCPEIINELYGSNDRAVENVKEYSRVIGIDIDNEGNFKLQDEIDEDNVNVFELPEVTYNDKGKVTNTRVATSRQEFMNNIGMSGGYLKIPFEMNYPFDDMPLKQAKDGSYLLPVLSSHLRSKTEIEDGTSISHEYTNSYFDVYNSAYAYQNTKAKIDNNEYKKNSKQYKDAVKKMNDAEASAKSAYSQLCEKIKTDQFEGKHNIFKDEVMKVRQKDSATAVVVADPNLKVEEIAVSNEIARELDVKDGNSIMVFRDPLLRGSGVQAMKVKIDDSLTGCAINPAMDKPFDGDFDGDSFGLMKIHSEKALKEAEQKLSIKNRLLDKGHMKEDGTYDFSTQYSLDIKVATYNDPKLKEEYDVLLKDVNRFEKQYEKDIENLDNKLDLKQISKEDYDQKKDELYGDISPLREESLDKLNTFYKKCFDDSYGKNSAISFENEVTMLESTKRACIDTGAKGSMSKLKIFAKYYGLDFEEDENGDIKFDTVKDTGKTQATRDWQIGTQKATNIKSIGTGIAGAYSQRGMAALRDMSPEAILELTYPNTQGILQAKHDPEEALKKFDALMINSRALWNGKKVECVGRGTPGEYWRQACDINGYPEKLTKEEFVENIVDFYTSETGLNTDINRNFVEKIAENMTDDKGYIIPIGKLKEAKGSTLDNCAYGGTADTLYEMAKNNRNLYAGKNTSLLTPRSIRRNQENALKVSEGVENSNYKEKNFVKDDVKINGKQRVKSKNSYAKGSDVSSIKYEESLEDKANDDFECAI